MEKFTKTRTQLIPPDTMQLAFCFRYSITFMKKKKDKVKEEVKLINEKFLLFVLILNSWVDNLILANVYLCSIELPSIPDTD